jgi:diguanylate cyclase (GGDEF)-like protein
MSLSLAREPSWGPRRSRIAELDALHGAALAVSEQLEPETVLKRIVEGAASLVEGSWGYLYTVDEAAAKLIVRVGEGPFRAFVGTSIGADEGVAGLVWTTAKPHIENDYRRWARRRRKLGAATPASVLGVPLIVRERVVGVIGLCYMTAGRAFTQEDEAIVSRFAQLAALALERAELTAELRDELAQRRRTEEELLDAVARLTGSESALRRTQEEMVRRLSAAAEHRDGATGSHIERIPLYCDLIARRLGLDEATCEAVRIASPLHDIGKIGIPDEVLLKPGPLNTRERELIERHTEIGHRILSGSGSELLDLAASIALTHHERWDGCGYPARLRGEAIPFAGRIVAVADVFDALTSDRVYRAAFTSQDAIELMVAGRGTQFDPTILDAFLGLGVDVLGGEARTEGVSPAPEQADSGPEPLRAHPRSVPKSALSRGIVQAIRELERIDDGREAVDRALKELCQVAGQHVLASVYVCEDERLWCFSQAGYDQVRDGFELGQGVMGRALRTQSIQLVMDVRTDPDFIAAIPDLVSELTLPLLGCGAAGALNIETTGARLPTGCAEMFAPLAAALTARIDSLPANPTLDLATLARLCVHASSLRTVTELSDFATRTLGRLLGLDCSQIVLGDSGQGEATTGFWRRPESELEPLGRAQVATVAEALSGGNPTCTVGDLGDIGLAGIDRRCTGIVWLPLRVGGERVGTLIGRAREAIVLDQEQMEGVTLLAQQAAALIDLAQALRRERRAAITDSLSGLLNRRGFDERLREEIARSTRTGRPVALVLADCDDLKRVNDHLGHDAGDRMLRTFASLIRQHKRVTDIAGRIGGDEFALLLPEAELEDAIALVERLQERLRSLEDEPPTASFGLAVFPGDGRTSPELLHAADRALYAAKHKGKNRLATADSIPLARMGSN